MRRLRHSIPSVAGLALVLATGATAAAGGTGQAAGAGVPADFSPAATTWTLPDEGWVLGYVPCEAGSCAEVLHTLDGGASWARLRPPGLHPSEFGNDTRIQVSQTSWRTTLVATNSEETVISTTGGESWRAVDVPADRVGDLAATSGEIYLTAHTTEGDQVSTTLWRTPNTRSDWEQVDGVSAEVPGQLGSVMSDIATDPWGPRLVGSSSFAAPTHAWSWPGGSAVEEIEAPCGDLATQFFGLSDDDHQFALCSQNPGRGHMEKELLVSADGVTFEPADSLPPDSGITSDFAVADDDVVAIGATGGDAGIVHMTFDGGQTWQTPLFEADTGPVRDLTFQDPDHGVLLTGYPGLGTSVVFRTSDGGHTWEPLDL